MVIGEAENVARFDGQYELNTEQAHLLLEKRLLLGDFQLAGAGLERDFPDADGAQEQLCILIFHNLRGAAR